MILVRDLSHRFENLLYENVNFRLGAGECMAILGVSGSGKSSLLNHLSTMLKPSFGRVGLLEYPDIYSLNLQKLLEIRRYDLGIIFQAHYLFAGFSAMENLKIATLLTQNEIDEKMLQSLGIWDILHQGVGSLSGGQQQRVSIARVLCKRPKIIFADEPTGNLDSKTAQAVMQNIFTYIKTNQACLVLATHDESIAQECDYIYRLKDKKLCQIK